MWNMCHLHLQYSIYRSKTVVRPSCLYKRNSCSETTSLYWNNPPPPRQLCISYCFKFNIQVNSVNLSRTECVGCMYILHCYGVIKLSVDIALEEIKSNLGEFPHGSSPSWLSVAVVQWSMSAVWAVLGQPSVPPSSESWQLTGSCGGHCAWPANQKPGLTAGPGASEFPQQSPLGTSQAQPHGNLHTKLSTGHCGHLPETYHTWFRWMWHVDF